MSSKEIREQFGSCWEGLEDPRSSHAALHDFHELLMIPLCCVLCGGQVAVGVVRMRETVDKATTETVCYLLSRVLSLDRLNQVAQQLWSMKNSLHSWLEVVMNEDQDRTRMGHGPHNLAALLQEITR